MPRRSSSPSGRALLVLLMTAVLILVVYDITGPGSMLMSLWDSFFPGSTPVEGFRDNVVDKLGIPPR